MQFALSLTIKFCCNAQTYRNHTIHFSSGWTGSKPVAWDDYARPQKNKLSWLSLMNAQAQNVNSLRERTVCLPPYNDCDLKEKPV